jgi:hypothetical protein
VSKEVRSQEGKKPVTFTHVFAMVGLIAAVFWLISRFRN